MSPASRQPKPWQTLRVDHRGGVATVTMQRPEVHNAFDATLVGELTDERLEEALQDAPDSEDIYAAVILEATPKLVHVYRSGGERIAITEDGLKFAARLLGDRAAPNQRLRRGDIVRIAREAKNRWHITQLPAVESALVAA